MILTLTLNPAVDISITTDRIIYDDRMFMDDQTAQASGKGVNIAHVLHSFGADVESIATYGGRNGERFQRLILETALPVRLIAVAGETRRNLNITDRQGLTLKLDERGAGLSRDELERIRGEVADRLPSVSWLTLTGSLPPGTPPDFYREIIELATKHGVKTLLDTSGDALPVAVTANPTLAKPNLVETERLLGRSLLGELDVFRAAEDVRKLGAQHVILSMGQKGAVAVWENGRMRVKPPSVQTGSPIGAGDVLGAACVWALARGESFPEAFVWGVAAATLASSLSGLQFGTLDQVRDMKKQLEVTDG